jgi:DNA-binding MarR family transcriptional regulator
MSGDFDPRDLDARERNDGIHDREDEWLVLGRQDHLAAIRDQPIDQNGRGRDDDWREERHDEPPARDDERGGNDARDVIVRDLDLPRGPARELVHDRDRDYTLDGSEARTLAIVGAFRVVSERDLHDPRDHTFDIRHLEKQGLVERVPLNEHERAVTATTEGRDLLERHRDTDSNQHQVFYAGADRARERTHDVEVYRAYLREAEKLQEREARVLGVELDRELKREYQRFLQERNRGDRDSDGRPDRTREEVEAWAHEHDLPYFDQQVHFPDARIEYQDVDGHIRHVDIEITTEHYRGAHGTAAVQSGFRIHCGGTSRSGGSAFDPDIAEEFL